jgi:hypothetical protein
MTLQQDHVPRQPEVGDGGVLRTWDVANQGRETSLRVALPGVNQRMFEGGKREDGGNKEGAKRRAWVFIG